MQSYMVYFKGNKLHFLNKKNGILELNINTYGKEKKKHEGKSIFQRIKVKDWTALSAVNWSFSTSHPLSLFLLVLQPDKAS